MTHRERFRTVLDGGVPDRTLWVPRLDLWYNARKLDGTLPDEVRDMTLAEVEDHLGMGHSSRRGSVYRIRYAGLQERTERQGENVVHTFVTPEGEASCTWFDPPDARRRGLTSVFKEHYIKSDDDYGVMEYVARHMMFEPAYDEYHKYDAEVGDEGYPLVIVGPSPIHVIMLRHLGYERFFYGLMDSPKKIEGLLKALESAYRRMWDVVAESPAELVLHGVHFSADMTPPPVFAELFVPYFREFNAHMHGAGKRVAFHADADLAGLLELVRQCDFDVADTFASAPLVRCTFDEAREAWDDRTVIWGGVPSIIIEASYPRDEFERYMRDLVEKTAGQPGFIMAVSDNIMPGAEFERLVWIRDLLAAHSP